MALSGTQTGGPILFECPWSIWMLVCLSVNRKWLSAEYKLLNSTKCQCGEQYFASVYDLKSQQREVWLEGKNDMSLIDS